MINDLQNIKTVANFAKAKKVTVSYIYKLLNEVKEGKKTSKEIGFELIQIDGVNFIKSL